MKLIVAHQNHRALTRVEVVVVVAAITLLVALFLPALAKARARTSRIHCVNNLKQVALSFRIWAGDNEDSYPMQVSVTNGGTMEFVLSGAVFPHFQVMSNELNTPKVLVCPGDRSRTAATNFVVGFDDSHISYFVGVDCHESRTNMFLAGDRQMTRAGGALPSGLHALDRGQQLGWAREIHRKTPWAGKRTVSSPAIFLIVTPESAAFPTNSATLYSS